METLSVGFTTLFLSLVVSFLPLCELHLTPSVHHLPVANIVLNANILTGPLYFACFSALV